MDLWYVEHVSLWTDVKILGLTVVAVFKSRGTEPPVNHFEGNPT